MNDDVIQNTIGSQGASEDHSAGLPQNEPTPHRRSSVPLMPTVSESESPREAGHLWSRLTWFVASLVVLLVLRFLLPQIVEELQYSITRGKQRAEYEQATKALESLPLEELSRAYQSISKKIGPSVVHINVSEYGRASPHDEFSYMSRGQRREPTGQGSGVIVDPKGFIVTNRHVVENALEIQVSLSDGRTVEASVVGADALTDIAVLRIEADNLIAAEWGNSDSAEVGALVWAIGSPFGLARSITSGILSAKNRGDRAGSVHQDFLQTDAPVNPGNSGGPLVDTRGRVIGITTAIVGDVYQGIGFAVPSTIARDVYERIKNNGRVARGWLGVRLDSVTGERAAKLGINETQGAFITSVTVANGVESPAAQAGIRVGDVIKRWNVTDIRSPEELMRMVARAEIGSTAEVVVLREGRELTLRVRVGERPEGLN